MNATQRNATQRNATQRNATGIIQNTLYNRIHEGVVLSFGGEIAERE